MRHGAVEQVAVFLDFENLVMGACRALPAVGHEAVSAPALQLLCRQRGDARIRRAYADWGQPQFGAYQEALALNRVDLVQVKRFGMRQKNAADIRMAVDAMETLISHPEVSTFVLVAGDGDYSPLVQRLREYGKTVVGVGTEASTSQRLVAVCSEYWYWGDLVAEAHPLAPATAATEVDLKSALQVLLRALEATADAAAGGWAAAGPLKNRMLVLRPDFDNADYGAKTFSAFLKLPEVANLVEVKRRDDGQTLARRRGKPARVPRLVDCA